MKSQTYRHVTAHNGSFTWQLSILGYPCRTNEHFETPEAAAISVDLVKHYLRAEFKLDLPVSIDPEQFSSLAYSRRHVDLSDYLSVLKSMPGDTKNFIEKHRLALEAHRDAQPAETIYSKFRRSGMFSDARIKEWVERCEAAEDRAKAFSGINHIYFFSLLDALSSRLSDALAPLRRGVKMHEKVSDALLVDRACKLSALVDHLEQNLDYVNHLTNTLRAEQAEVENAVSLLEANRPALT